MFFLSATEVLAALATLVAALGFSLWMGERTRLRALRRQHDALTEAAAELELRSPQAILTVDAAGLIRGYNPAAQALFGYEFEEVYGHLVFQLIALNEAGKQQTRAQDGGSYQLAAEARLKDGTLRPVLLHATPLRAGAAPRARFQIEDLSLRRHQAQLEIENSLLWPTFDEAGLVIAMVDSAGEIIRLSETGIRLLQLSDAEVEGRLYWEVLEPPEDWDRARAAFEQAKQTLGPTRVKASWVAPDGLPIPLDWVMLSPSWDNRNGIEHVVVTAALATRAGGGAPQTTKVIERIAGRIAGHFENLLSTINGYSELVLHDLKRSSPLRKDELRKDVQQILDASQRASESLRQLLGFSGCRLILPERVELDGILPSSNRLAVLANRKALEEMLAAIREYAPEAGFGSEPATIGTPQATLGDELAPGDYVKLSATLPNVTEQEVSQHLIEPFSSPLRGSRQTSVGLAMVHGLARSCGGGVAVTPNGRGVMLDIWLPAAPAQASRAEPVEEPAAARRAAS